MPAEPKTPGEVAYEAYHSPYLGNWRGHGDHGKAAWEKAAEAVRHQLGCQNRTDELVSAHLIRDVGMIRDIRKVMHEWRTIDPDFDTGGVYDNEPSKLSPRFSTPLSPRRKRRRRVRRTPARSKASLPHRQSGSRGHVANCQAAVLNLVTGERVLGVQEARVSQPGDRTTALS